MGLPDDERRHVERLRQEATFRDEPIAGAPEFHDALLAGAAAIEERAALREEVARLRKAADISQTGGWIEDRQKRSGCVLPGHVAVRKDVLDEILKLLDMESTP